MQDEIVITGAGRTAIGGFQGTLSSKTAPELGGHAIQAVLANADHIAPLIDEVIMGCVLPAGLGQAPRCCPNHKHHLQRLAMQL